MGRKLVDVASQLDALIGEIGLEKYAAASDDPGTSHPAKQEDSRSGIQTASSGSRSAENSADVKAGVQGQAVDEAKNTDKKGKSDPDVITDAATTGKDPKVERSYTDRAKDPGTAHPAKAGTGEKYASLHTAADSILDELTKLADDGEGKMTAEEKQAADHQAGEWLEGYCKSASLLGELTADYLDGMATGMKKKAEGEEEMMAAQAAQQQQMAGGAPEGAGAPEGDPQADLAALAEAIQQVAAEAGVSPEEVMMALEAQLGAGEEMPPEAGPEMGPEMGPKEASDRQQAIWNEQIMMSTLQKVAANNAELAQAIVNEQASAHNVAAEMQKKAQAYDELIKQQEMAKTAEANKAQLKEALHSVLGEFKAQQSAE